MTLPPFGLIGLKENVKKMFTEIRLCNVMTYVFKGHVIFVKI